MILAGIMTMTNPIRSRRVPRFVEEFCGRCAENGTKAAIAAGWPESWAHTAAYELLKEPEVQEMIRAERARLTKEATIEAVDILREWLDVATADPSKLVKVRRVNCRYCHGAGHEYQWKAREYAEACDVAARAEKPAPDCAGGFGFKSNADPHPECPECDGDGVEDVLLADIGTLSGPERKLFAGVKRTRNGPEIILRDQDKARDNLARYLGMLVDRKELTGKNGAALLAPATILVCGPDE